MNAMEFNEQDRHTVRAILEFIAQHPVTHIFKDGVPFAGKTLKKYDFFLCRMERWDYIQGCMLGYTLTDSPHSPYMMFRIEILDKGKRLLKSPPQG